jgi:hypothetical protein
MPRGKRRGAVVPVFTIQFDPAEIQSLSQRYQYEEDTGALAAGARISQQKKYTRNNLETIYKWKTRGRGISRIAANTDAEIADALRLAVAARTERSALAVLLGLVGIAIPVASAVLTVINPKRYTIIDVRALEALGAKPRIITVGYYLAYLRFCCALALKQQVSLRVLDRALWQWSREQSGRRRKSRQAAAKSSEVIRLSP